jgi:hypothetical protein
MTRGVAILLAVVVAAGCSVHQRAASAGDAEQCEDDMRLIVATNTSSRYQDLMYGNAKVGTVEPGKTIRVTVKGQQRAYFRQTPMVTHPPGNRETTIAPYLTCA